MQCVMRDAKRSGRSAGIVLARRILAGAVLLGAVLLVISIFAGCDGLTIGEPSKPECSDGTCPATVSVRVRPVGPVHRQPCPRQYIDIPDDQRLHNYGGGSCNWAALATLMGYYGFAEHADYIRHNQSGAAGVWNLAAECKRLKLKYSYTDSGETGLLEWASANRHPAAIHFKPSHACTFGGFFVDSNGKHWAAVIDNNHPGEIEWWTKPGFLRDWLSRGGNALVLVYSPPAPRPRI